MLFDNEKLKDISQCHILLLLIVVVSFVLRMYLRTNYLDDWDSVQFMLGLKDYSILAHQPHPPGYPVYIFLGRVFNIIFDDGLQTFTFMSAFFGSLALIPTYLLAEKFFDNRVGLLAAVLLALTPVHLLFSVVVMTDIVSSFFVTSTACLLYMGLRSTKYLYLASLMMGITMGIRWTDILLIPLFIIVLIYRKQLKICLVSGLIALAGVCLWFIPVLLDTGFNTFIAIQKAQWIYASGGSTLSSLGGLTLSNLLITLRAMMTLFIEGWSSVFIIFLLITGIVILIKMKNRYNCVHCIVDKRLVFILSWLVPYFLFAILFYMLYIPRYLLPLFPPLSIIFAYSMIELAEIPQRRWIKGSFFLIFAILIAYMGSQAIASAYAIHTTAPAPVQAAEWVKGQYSPQDTIVIAGGSFKHFQYYLPNFTTKFDIYLSPYEIYNFLIENKTIISEGSPPTFDTTSKAYIFERPKIYPKHECVKLYEFKMCDEQLPILTDGGWHGLEDWGGTPTRWMSDDATLMIYSDKNRTADLSFQALSFYRPRTLEIYVNDLPRIWADIPTEGFVMVNVPISLNEGANVVRFHVPEGCERPCDIPELNNADTRCLSLSVQNITIT